MRKADGLVLTPNMRGCCSSATSLFRPGSDGLAAIFNMLLSDAGCRNLPCWRFPGLG